MKIAYFLGSLNRGGAETLICDICRNHEQVPYDFICLYRHEGNMSDDFHQSGAELVQVPKKGSLLRYIIQLRRTLLREHITIVHSQTPSNTLVLALALIGLRIKVITTFHNHPFANASWWKRALVYVRSSKILFVSQNQLNYYQERWPAISKKAQVVYNGIDFSKMDLAEPSTVFIQPPKTIRLAMVGNFVSGRSQSIIVRSILRLQQMTNHKSPITNVPFFDFYFIGRRDSNEPWRYDDCVRYCEEHQLANVHFLGSRGDVPSLLKSMDGFVYSTNHDTFGIALVEAMASGLPVVVNDWQVMQEVCDLGLPISNRAVRFFRTDDVEVCAKQIESMLSDIKANSVLWTTHLSEMKNAARAKYAIQSHINNLHHIYSQL